MRIRLALVIAVGVLLLVLSCTTKKPSEVDQVAVFKGRVIDKSTGRPLDNLLIYLIWFKGETCTCGVGDVITCVGETKYIIAVFDTGLGFVADTTFAFSLQDRSLTHVYDFEL
jgi:hypothetical protein